MFEDIHERRTEENNMNEPRTAGQEQCLVLKWTFLGSRGDPEPGIFFTFIRRKAHFSWRTRRFRTRSAGAGVPSLSNRTFLSYREPETIGPLKRTYLGPRRDSEVQTFFKCITRRARFAKRTRRFRTRNSGASSRSDATGNSGRRDATGNSGDRGVTGTEKVGRSSTVPPLSSPARPGQDRQPICTCNNQPGTL